MTVIINQINDFGSKSLKEAKAILYDVVVPACEAQNVFLSDYGNHNTPSTLSSQKMQMYYVKKESQFLFSNVARIQQIFNKLDGMIQTTNLYSATSRYLKNKIGQSFPGHHIWNGELIAAMILKGHPALFSKRGRLNVNCLFKAE